MFALVDCNCFYVSCERVFQPHLGKRPVIVLSSNDGCAISRSPEAKALGIKMGIPFFKILETVKRHNIAAYSSNFTLYNDMSWRVMETLKKFSPHLEIYSIDEAFLDVRGIPMPMLFSYGCQIKKTVKQGVGIPVSVGIGPTKTLAKVANYFAKREASGCYVFADQKEAEKALKNVPLKEVWGIGPKWSEKLVQYGVGTAFDLAKADVHWIRKTFNVVLARTALELRGTSCLRLKEVSPLKKSIISSRTFGSPVTSFDLLKEAVAYHACRVARKLRDQKSKATLISVSIRTSPFQKGEKFYSNTKLLPLLVPSQDSSTLITASLKALESIYQTGFLYKKSGVTALNIVPEEEISPSLFVHEDPKGTLKRTRLLKVVDSLNNRHGNRAVFFASEGTSKAWKSKKSWISPNYTTRWQDLVRVR